MCLEKIPLSLYYALLRRLNACITHVPVKQPNFFNCHYILSKVSRPCIIFVTRMLSKTYNSSSSRLALLHLD